VERLPVQEGEATIDLPAQSPYTPCPERAPDQKQQTLIQQLADTL
jgi:hypothetical protein